MSRPVIVVGDRTSHGGVVITGSPFSDIDGKAIARIGDKVTCPQKGHGNVTTIVTGDITDMIDGSPVARHGDKTACGAMLISSQMLTYTDDGGDNSNTHQGASSKPFALGNAGTKAQEAAYDQHFHLIDEVTGEPLGNRAYRIKWSGGVIEGRTNKAGFTAKIEAAHPEEIKIEVFAEGAQWGR